MLDGFEYDLKKYNSKTHEWILIKMQQSVRLRSTKQVLSKFLQNF